MLSSIVPFDFSSRRGDARVMSQRRAWSRGGETGALDSLERIDWDSDSQFLSRGITVIDGRLFVACNIDRSKSAPLTIRAAVEICCS
jgi:phosphoribosyl-AMP cyclohydrolase